MNFRIYWINSRVVRALANLGQCEEVQRELISRVVQVVEENNLGYFSGRTRAV